MNGGGDEERWRVPDESSDEGEWSGLEWAPPAWEPVLEEDRPVWNWFGSCPVARRRRRAFDPSNPAQWLAGILMGGAIAVVGLGIILQAVFVLMEIDPGGGDGFTVANLVIGLILLGAPPLVWVAAFYRGGVRAWGSRLFLASRRPTVELGLGVGAAVAMVLLLIPVGYLLEALGLDTENPVLDELVPQLTWPLIVMIAGSAAIGEELFFRGFLQPRIGIVFTNVLFGLVHAGYATLLQVLVPMGLGFVFSWLVVRTRSLLPAILAHFLFNFLVLSIQKVAFESGLI